MRWILAAWRSLESRRTGHGQHVAGPHRDEQVWNAEREARPNGRRVSCGPGDWEFLVNPNYKTESHARKRKERVALATEAPKNPPKAVFFSVE